MTDLESETDAEAPTLPASEDRARDGIPTAGLFYRGKLVHLFWGTESGTVRSASGRDIPFRFPHVRIVGEPAGFAALREGMDVGFDVGWTAHGLCVTVLRPLP
jgi:hypothetical protein